MTDLLPDAALALGSLGATTGPFDADGEADGMDAVVLLDILEDERDADGTLLLVAFEAEGENGSTINVLLFALVDEEVRDVDGIELILLLFVFSPEDGHAHEAANPPPVAEAVTVMTAVTVVVSTRRAIPADDNEAKRVLKARKRTKPARVDVDIASKKKVTRLMNSRQTEF